MLMRLALVSSVGGHLTELLELCQAFDDWERFWVINDVSPVLPDGERVYRIAHGERDWRVAWNVVEVAAIFAREKPDLMLSMGAGPAVSAAVVARAGGIPIIYVEPSSAVTNLTLTGRLMRHLATRFYVQWERLREAAPWAEFRGSVL
jgi:UDP-N-acetylglucosamine:LPS N-acetylglucosamine transferase